MKKRRVIVFVVCLFLISLSYAAFCLRGFYVKPTIKYIGGTSQDKSAIIEEWFKSNGQYDYPELNLDGAVHSLMNPYKETPNATVSQVPAIGYLLTVDCQYIAVFREINGKFQYVEKLDF